MNFDISGDSLMADASEVDIRSTIIRVGGTQSRFYEKMQANSIETLDGNTQNDLWIIHTLLVYWLLTYL